MNKKEADQLIENYLNGSASPAECLLVENWYASQNEKQFLSESDNFEHLKEELFENILLKAKLKSPITINSLWPKIAAAALIVMTLSATGYYFGKKDAVLMTITRNKQSPAQEISPEVNKAILTLANGLKIQLKGSRNGLLATDGNVRINKMADGQIAYDDENKSVRQISFNTMTTPRGCQYNVTLADGTKVFLNAASSITYPTNFIHNDRTIILNGEAYFEVAHNALKPFRVISNGQTIEVLGTHFNVHSYQDESINKTTLLEGSIKITSGKTNARLEPGQQSLINQNGKVAGIVISEVNTDESIAWTHGFFEFKNASTREVMLSAARWYDLNITYSNETSDIKITGSISRNVNLSGLINLLEFEGVKFNINGKNIKVLN